MFGGVERGFIVDVKGTLDGVPAAGMFRSVVNIQHLRRN